MRLERFWRRKPKGRASPAAGAATRLRYPRPGHGPSRRVAWRFFMVAGRTARLSHYFLPRLLMEGKRVLFLDGANSADPRLLARLARERGVAFEQFSRQIQIARAFTCFQLTELIARVPRFLADFPAQVLVVTALPDLYFDGDVRDWDARVAFERALGDLRRYGSGEGFPGQRDCRAAVRGRGVFFLVRFYPTPSRKRFFQQTCAAATEVWKFTTGEGGTAKLLCMRSLSAVSGQLKDRVIERFGE